MTSDWWDELNLKVELWGIEESRSPRRSWKVSSNEYRVQREAGLRGDGYGHSEETRLLWWTSQARRLRNRLQGLMSIRHTSAQ